MMHPLLLFLSAVLADFTLLTASGHSPWLLLSDIKGMSERTKPSW